MKRITLEDAKRVIRKYGIDEDKYMTYEYLIHPNISHTKKKGIQNFYQRCLKMVVKEGLKNN